jgi:hypothetical protein
LALNPVAEVRISKAFEVRSIESVVVRKDREPIPVTIPDVPDEGAIHEQSAVLFEELISQPIVQVLLLASRLLKQRPPPRGPPGFIERYGEQLLKPFSCRRLAGNGRETEDPVRVRKHVKVV